MRAHDWTATPLGRPEAWPQSLRVAVSIMLNSRYPIALYWGSELALLYNDAWSPIPGGKHPWALGQPGRAVWPEIWETIGPLYAQVFSTGQGVWQEDELLPMRRHGYLEECYYNFTFSPVRGEDGSIHGIFNAVVETTDRVLAERRLRTLSRMGERTDSTLTVEAACRWVTDILAENAADVPFALVYVREDDAVRLAAAAGLEPGSMAAPRTQRLADEAGPWPLADAQRSSVAVTIAAPEHLDLRQAVWPEPVTEVVLISVLAAGEARPTAFLVAGANPRRRIDATYRSFFELAAGHIGTALATARAYEEERRRAEALAELDRAKTAFFANVSHEFRTPLTLMLGPLEEVLAKPETAAGADERALVLVAHRNGLRLLRLVNTLLDFSRIEAGRSQARFAPTDLAASTAELASSFRSATEKAGLALTVDCPPLDQPAYVDRDMWEKIVLNLLSNAFKFTFAGEIAILLRQEGGKVCLSVRDTGTGIPADELPRLFERFHRVQGAKGRSLEGSGIGLALVQELVKLHDGEIAVESAVGRGTGFRVTLPLGSAHLPVDQIEAAPPSAAVPVRARSFVEEALRWLPGGSAADALLETGGTLAATGDPGIAGAAGRRILLADDNADLRRYIARLLGDRGYEVQAVTDGQAALEAIRGTKPDLLVTDVMMPRLDGFGLLRAVRDDPELRDLPIVMLSARAGEEARVEGLDAGADDYLTKPFSARELLARVDTTLAMARMRREATEALREREARYRLAVLATNDAIRDWDLIRDHVVWNEAVTTLFGYPLDAVPSSSAWWFERIHANDRQRVVRGIHALIDGTANDWTEEYRFGRADGSFAAVLDRCYLVRNSSGAPVRMIGAMLDLTERKRSEALRDAQNRVLELAIQDTSLEETLATLMRTVEAVAPSEMLGSVLLLDADGVHLRHSAAPSLPDAYNKAIDGISVGPGAGSCGTAVHTRKPVYVADIASDPLWRDFRELALSHGLRACWSVPIRSRHGGVLGTFAMYYRQPREPAAADLELVDLVTRSASLAIEHKRAEAALHKLNETLEARVHERTRERDRIWNLSRDPFLVADTQGRWLSMSPVWSELLGWSEQELLGRTSEWMEHPDDRARTRDEVVQLASGKTTERFLNRFRGKDERYRWFSWMAVPEGGFLYAVARDVTAEKEQAEALRQAEAALRQAQKMEAMGQLTGGVAHDFNNLLTPIVGSLDMLQRKKLGGEREQRLIAGALQSAERAKTLVQRLLAFARRQPLQAGPVDVGKLVTGMADLIASTSGPQIKVAVEVREDLPAAEADPNQLEMALLNLAVNARDAMPDGGTLRVSASPDQVGFGHRSGLRAGRYVRLSVADTGVGMDEATLARAVEPFFSTKGVGQGTGLGLSMAHGLALQLGGAMTIQSRRGVGTNVEFWLPISHVPAAAAEPAVEIVTPPVAAGLALLVDDEDLVRLSTAEMLIELGYEVVDAASAEDALRQVRQGLQPDLLVTDHLMPGMNGTDLARLVQSAHPRARILIVSGYAEIEGLAPDLARLAKPFRSDELAASLANLRATGSH